MAGIARRALLALPLLAAAGGARAQTYPSRPIRVILSFPAGGLADALARGLLDQVSEQLGQPLFVEPRSGGSQAIAARAVADAPADGYTLMFASDGAFIVNPHIFARLPYDPERDFAPVSLVAGTVECLFVPTALGVNSVAELIALAKARPGELNYGSFGPGSPPHIEAEAFRIAAGLDIVHVPYRGVSETVPALLAGHIQILFASQAQALPHVRVGTLKALAVLAEQRQPTLPDVPTIGEAGFPDLLARAWFGIVAPAATPGPILDRLSAAFARAAEAPEFRARLIDAQGLVPMPTGREAFARVWADDGARSATRLRAMQLRLD